MITYFKINKSFSKINSKSALLLLYLLIYSLNLKAQTDSTATDSIHLKQIEQQMQVNQMPAPQPTRSGISSSPDIGLVADFGASY